MRYLKYLLGSLLAVSLVACGGGGGSSGSGTGGGTTPVVSKVASIDLTASAANLDSASTTGITVTAVLKDKDNNAVPSEAFAYSATSGVVQAQSTTSDGAGKAVATITPGADRSNRNITVTVTAGLVSQKLVIPVLGTTLTINGGSSMLIGATATYTIALKDSTGTGISGASLAVASALGNTLSASTVTTNTAGTASFNYVATKGGADTLTVSGLGTAAQYSVAISTLDFSFQSPASGASIAVNTPSAVRVRLLSNGVGVPNQVINFSSTRGAVSIASVTTDGNGEATTNISSTTAGPATVAAQVASGGQTTLGVNFVAVTPASLVLQANVNAVAPNAAGSSTNRATLTAVVKDSFGNPVKGRTVNFSLIADTSAGSIENGTGSTDANGVVTASFIAGAASTASNGVVIEATVSNTSPAIAGRTSITVNAQSLFISFAMSNTIGNLNENTYSKPFSVYVTDANGAAVANQVIALSVYPVSYAKGQLALNVTGTTTSTSSTGVVTTTTTKGWGISSYQSCPNEDVNRDGILQAGEDNNGDGRLTPGLPGVLAPATLTTDASGQANFVLNYGEQYAPWVNFDITARAVVAGTESTAVVHYTAAASAADLSNEQASPAGQLSPFGTLILSTPALTCASPN